MTLAVTVFPSYISDFVEYFGVRFAAFCSWEREKKKSFKPCLMSKSLSVRALGDRGGVLAASSATLKSPNPAPRPLWMGIRLWNKSGVKCVGFLILWPSSINPSHSPLHNPGMVWGWVLWGCSPFRGCAR